MNGAFNPETAPVLHVDAALSTGRDARCAVFAGDGEGYHVEIKIRSLEYMRDQEVPYTAEYARPRQIKFVRDGGKARR